MKLLKEEKNFEIKKKNLTVNKSSAENQAHPQIKLNLLLKKTHTEEYRLE